MLYIKYDDGGNISGFSDSRPKGKRYFELEPEKAWILVEMATREKQAYLIIENHKPVGLAQVVDISSKSHVMLNANDIPFSLVMTAARDLETARRELDNIHKERKRLTEYRD